MNNHKELENIDELWNTDAYDIHLLCSSYIVFHVLWGACYPETLINRGKLPAVHFLLTV